MTNNIFPTEGKSNDREDRALWLAVVYQHMWDASRGMLNTRNPVSVSAGQLYERDVWSARTWIFDPNKDFQEVCDMANVPVSLVRSETTKGINRLVDYYEENEKAIGEGERVFLEKTTGRSLDDIRFRDAGTTEKGENGASEQRGGGQGWECDKYGVCG